MRKMMNRAVAFVLAVSVCFGSTNVVALAQENMVLQPTEQVENVIENVESGETQQEQDDYFDNKCTIHEVGHFRVVNCLTDQWEGGFNASFVVENVSDMDIRNWYIRFPAQFKIANIWNAEIERVQDGVCLVKNVGWNSVIEAGGCVQFGVTVYENFTKFPDTYEILGTNVKVAEDAYEIAYEIYNDWGTGFTGAITIKNISEEVIEDWKLAFDFENEFTDIWNAKIVSQEGGNYELLNAGYNSNIGMGESVSIGFVVGNGDALKTMTNSILSAFSLEDFTEGGQADIQEDQGESYVKNAAEEDIIFDKEGGVHYVKNQIIVSAHLGASKELMSNLAEELSADIVGYIKLTEDYQLEFREEMSYTELMEKIAYVKGFPFVRYAEVNLASPCEVQAFSNDTLYTTDELWVTEWRDLDGDGVNQDKEAKTTKQAGKNDGWKLYLVGGNNWGPEALNVDEAWDYKDKYQRTVRVGIYDSMFGENKDLEIEVISAEPDIIDSAHGTHVAGIIGAKHNNNNRGISGVATDVDLYGYAAKGGNATFYYGIERLIKKGVRVINVSYGYNEGFAYAATKAANGNYENDPYKMIIREANALSDKLQRLIERGYDFLIVNSAGNGNGKKYVIDLENTELDESYVLYNSKNSNHTGLTQYIGYPDAKYNYHISAIEEKAVKSRIMVVGSVGHTISGLKTTYWIAGSSMEGERVDTYAPGVRILSTVPEAEFSDGYMVMSGTSMAAPHITGLAAFMWQVNPELTAAQVKKIIKENKGLQIGTTGKYMPDAKKCVMAALNAIE